MRFRRNGTLLTQPIAKLLVAVLALSALIAATPVSAQAAVSDSRTSALEAISSTVPNVVGWSASAAATALRSHGLAYQFIAPAGQRVTAPSLWTVTAQTPKAATRARRGTVVKLTLETTASYRAQAVRSFYAQDYGTFSASNLAGTGAAVILLPAHIKTLLVKSSYTGPGAFRIVELGANNAPTGISLVNVVGSFSGYDAVGLMPQKITATALQVSGSGNWQISLMPIASAPIVTLPIVGSGDSVYLYSGPSATWTVSSPGPTTFTLNQVSSSSYPNLAVNESGNWAGRVALQPGPSVIQIDSNGSWSIH